MTSNEREALASTKRNTLLEQCVHLDHVSAIYSNQITQLVKDLSCYQDSYWWLGSLQSPRPTERFNPGCPCMIGACSFHGNKHPRWHIGQMNDFSNKRWITIGQTLALCLRHSSLRHALKPPQENGLSEIKSFDKEELLSLCATVAGCAIRAEDVSDVMYTPHKITAPEPQRKGPRTKLQHV